MTTPTPTNAALAKAAEIICKYTIFSHDESWRLALLLSDAGLLRPDALDVRTAEGTELTAWENVAEFMCCGPHGCNAVNHSVGHDMSPERYCKEYGCESKDIYEAAENLLLGCRVFVRPAPASTAPWVDTPFGCHKESAAPSEPMDTHLSQDEIDDWH